MGDVGSVDFESGEGTTGLEMTRRATAGLGFGVTVMESEGDGAEEDPTDGILDKLLDDAVLALSSSDNEGVFSSSSISTSIALTVWAVTVALRLCR